MQVWRLLSIYTHSEVGGQTSKKSKKSGGKDQLPYWESFQFGCVISRLSSEKVYSSGSWTVGIESRRQILQGHVTPHKYSGTKGSMLFRSANLMSAAFVLQGSRKEHKMKPCNKKDAPAEKHGHWRKVSISSIPRTRPRSSRLLKFGHH